MEKFHIRSSTTVTILLYLESSEGYLTNLVRMEKFPFLAARGDVKLPHCPGVGEVNECVSFVTPCAAEVIHIDHQP